MTFSFVLCLSALVLEECWALVPREICLGSLGCFENSGPFQGVLRPLSLLPDRPEAIGTTFRLYTPQNPLLSQILNEEDSSLDGSSFNSRLETKVLVHGFRESEEDWMIDFKEAFLAKEDLNIITVDWSGGSGIPYIQAVPNTRVVGAQLAQLIQRLQNRTGLDLDKVHLIGFSLGAHICGYAGERLDKVRRITGLDPAGPMFEDLLPVVSLDPSDAQFVDAIHTDGRSLLQIAFGSFSPMGHVDFYPNGGLKQPGCPENALETVSYATLDALLRGLDDAGEEVTCRHGRAKDLFLETVREVDGCVPVAYPCEDWDTFKDGSCASCGLEGKECGIMGLGAEDFKPEFTSESNRTKLYLKTSGGRPYCLFHYNVTVRIPGGQEERRSGGLSVSLPLVSVSVGSNYGQLEIAMTGDRRVSAHGHLGEGNQAFQPGTEHTFLFLSEQDLGQIESLLLKWRPGSASTGILRLNVAISDELPVADVLVRPMRRSFGEQAVYAFSAEQREHSVASERGLLMRRVEERRANDP